VTKRSNFSRTFSYSLCVWCLQSRSDRQ